MITNYLMGSGILYNKRANKNTLNHEAMAKDNNQIEQLKTLIREELKDCNHVLWPKVCEMQSTDEGLKRLEDMIIRNVAEEGMGIGSAIAFIEQELNHME